MGARANCVSIEHKRVRIYYGQWAALGVHTMLLSGLEGTLKQIRDLSPRDQLTDTVWAEGGLVVDCDKHKIKHWGGERYHVPHVRRYASLLWRHIWPEWTVSWAVFGQADIARACGIDPTLVIATDSDDQAFLYDSNALLAPQDLVAHGEPPSSRDGQLLSVRFPDGSSADYVLGVRGYDLQPGLCPLDLVLTLGPALAAVLPSLTPTVLGREDAYFGGVALDFQRKSMLVWYRWALDERKIAALQRRWSGWTIQTPADGPAQHLALLARDATAFLIPKNKCVQEMIDAFLVNLPLEKLEARQRVLEHVLQQEDSVDI